MIRYHRNFRNLILFGLGTPLNFHDGELIQTNILIKPILEHKKNLFLPMNYHTTPVN